METIKFLIVGDGNVGKTCILIMYTSDTFPDEYTPTVIDTYITDFSYKQRPYRMEIWDTAGQEEYRYLRSLSYGHTDVFFLCFSIADPTSLGNAEKLWYQEIRHHCPNAIVILVGTKMDLRENDETIQKLKKFSKSPVTYEEGVRCAKRIKAHTYLECSALNKQGLKEIFNNGVLAFFERKERPPSYRICSIL